MKSSVFSIANSIKASSSCNKLPVLFCPSNKSYVICNGFKHSSTIVFINTAYLTDPAWSLSRFANTPTQTSFPFISTSTGAPDNPRKICCSEIGLSFLSKICFVSSVNCKTFFWPAILSCPKMFPLILVKIVV